MHAGRPNCTEMMSIATLNQEITSNALNICHFARLIEKRSTVRGTRPLFLVFVARSVTCGCLLRMGTQQSTESSPTELADAAPAPVARRPSKAEDECSELCTLRVAGRPLPMDCWVHVVGFFEPFDLLPFSVCSSRSLATCRSPAVVAASFRQRLRSFPAYCGLPGAAVGQAAAVVGLNLGSLTKGSENAHKRHVFYIHANCERGNRV